ncbi:unnamed protein product [Schistosoma mattheei]|uniref:Uncharacterized protein n=1 Tax=Schistosoma mattheei TaxID=31246 RepID=A0A183Q438_9TREM|nr:unnamed protein product [Schistosoma mattheei]
MIKVIYETYPFCEIAAVSGDRFIVIMYHSPPHIILSLSVPRNRVVSRSETLSYSCHKLYSFGRISTVSVKDVIKMSTPN